MKKRVYFLVWAMTLGMLAFVSLKLSERDKIPLLDVNLVFFNKESPSPKYENERIAIYEDNDTLIELRGIDKLLNDSNALFSSTKIPMEFIKKLKEKNSKTSIRNGNLHEAEKTSTEYHVLLKQFKHVCDSLDLPMDISRKACFKHWKSLAEPPQRKGEVWNFFFQRRLQLKKAFKVYKEQLELMISTERVIHEQKDHFPDLYERMNSLTNLDGTSLAVYIISYPKVFARSGQSVSGLTFFCIYQGLLTSLSPQLTAKYPELIGKKNSFTVHLKQGVEGKVLSHEFGHLYYLYHNWNDYLLFLRTRPVDYSFGGHGPNDPSGNAADLAEKGTLPRKLREN